MNGSTNYTLFSCVLFLLMVFCGCSPILARGGTGKYQIKRGNGQQYFTSSLSYAGLICSMQWCYTCPNTEWTWFRCCRCAFKKAESCFPKTAKVQLQNGKSVTISELQVGDQVQTVSSEGRLKDSKVRTFLQKEDSAITLYRSITTSWNNTITLSGNHLLYAKKGYNDKFSAIYADKVSIGDDVLVQRNGTLIPDKVIALSSFKIQDAYVPLTEDGSILVNGVLASCYASFDHGLAHFTMTPMQWYPKIMGWLIGVNSGYPAYVDLAKEFGRWVLPYELLYARRK